MNEKERGGELSRRPHVARCYGMLKIPAECDRHFAGKINATFLCFSLLRYKMSLLLLPESSGG
jgi:hypothetical protein